MSLLRHAAARTSIQLRARLVGHTHTRPATLIPHIRTYASKKKQKNAESKQSTSGDDLVPGSQRIAGGEVYHKAETSMKAILDRYRKEVLNLETRASGRVTPALLAPVRVKLPGHPGVDGKGATLEEIATVGVREGTTLLITVFEEQSLKHVEQAIWDAKLPGLSPQRADNRTIKIPVPKPTVEARHALYTTAQRHAEEARVHVRKQHSTSLKKGGFKKYTQQFDELQDLNDQYIKEIDKVLADLKKSTGAK